MKQVAGAHVPPVAVRPGSMRAILSALAARDLVAVVHHRAQGEGDVGGLHRLTVRPPRLRPEPEGQPQRPLAHVLPRGHGRGELGTYWPFSFTVSRFCWMFVAMRWPTVETPSARSTFDRGRLVLGVHQGAALLGGSSPSPDEPQPARRSAAAAAASAAAARATCRRFPRTARRRLPTCVTTMKRNLARGRWGRPGLQGLGQEERRHEEEHRHHHGHAIEVLLHDGRRSTVGARAPADAEGARRGPRPSRCAGARGR